MFFRSPFNNKKRSPEDWYQRLIRAKNPRDLASTLLSDEQTFEEKVKIILAMPESATEKLVDMRWLESELEKHGHHQLSQLVRWNLYWNLGPVSRENIRKWSQELVKTDVEVLMLGKSTNSSGRTQAGTSPHGCARIVLDAAVAVDEDVDVMRLRERIVDVVKLEDTAPLRVAVVSVQGG